jgi:DNA-directed RNA polymerase subunit RPC12/RpoP
MQACPCPRCGKPTRVVLSAPGLSCAACSYQGPYPAEIAAEVGAAWELFQRTTTADRQIRGTLRTAVERGRSYFWLTFLAGAAALAPLFLFTLLMILGALVGEDDQGDAFMLPMVLLPFPAAALSVFLAARSVRKGQRALESAFAAAPPLAPGEPAGCHVCGADLLSSGAGVVRCRYCSADNVVRSEVMQRATEKRESTARTQSEAAAEQIAQLRAVTFSAGKRTLKGAVGIPFLVSVLTVLALAIYSSMGFEADNTLAYVLVQQGKEQCVARLNPKGQKGLLTFGAQRVEDLPASRKVVPGEAMTPKRARDFVGWELRGRTATGVIESVQGSLVSGNEGVFEDGAIRRTISIQGSCVVHAPRR